MLQLIFVPIIENKLSRAHHALAETKERPTYSPYNKGYSLYHIDKRTEAIE